VVRHQLVQRIIRAYEGFGRQQPELPLVLGDGEGERKQEPVRAAQQTQ